MSKDYESFQELARAGRAEAEAIERDRLADPPGGTERDRLDDMLRDVVTALRAAGVPPSHIGIRCAPSRETSLANAPQFDYARVRPAITAPATADVWTSFLHVGPALLSICVTEHGHLVHPDYTHRVMYLQRMPFIGAAENPLPEGNVLDDLAFASMAGQPAFATKYAIPGGEGRRVWHIAPAREVLRQFIGEVSRKPHL